MSETDQMLANSDMVQNTEMGTVRMDDEVIAGIVAMTLDQIKGVAGTVGGASYSLTGMLGKKNSAKGVRVDMKDEGISINVSITVRYGYNIPDLARNVQRRITDEVRMMTGMKVRAVDLFVQSIVF